MSRRFTGFKPTGHLQLGNYLGAIRPTISGQDTHDTIVSIVDLHALTVEHDPARLRDLTLEVATVLLAAGIDPVKTVFFAQSHVRAHTALHYILECATAYGEAHRMIQFKEKSAGREHVRLSLLTYPTLMAADILAYGADEVPVGEDQRQHVELARDIAERFNSRYGQIFTVPHAVQPRDAARVMDLSDPLAKMGKTAASDAGVIFLLDTPDAVRRKVSRAVTDAETEVRFDPDTKPGVSNLLAILAACTDGDPATVGKGMTSYGELKSAVTDAVLTTLAPIQAEYAELDPSYVLNVLRHGAERAAAVSELTVDAAHHAIGLQPSL